MGKRVASADHRRKELSDPIDDHADLFLVSSGDELIATFRWLWAGRYVPDDYRRWFFERIGDLPLASIGFSSRLMVSSKWRQSPALRMLLSEAYLNTRAQGAWLDILNCAPFLVSMYEALGYRRISNRLIPTEGAGQSLAMALVVDDLAHLERVRSPLFRDARRLPSDPAHGHWFAATFPEYASPASRRLAGEAAFMNALSESLAMEDVKLFNGLSETNISDLLKQSLIINVPSGETIVRAGEVGHEMFVILDGVVETRVGSAERYVVPTTMTKGDVFGEVAFVQGGRRTANAVALNDTRLLILAPATLAQLVVDQPELSARLLFNLSKVLAERLANATDRYADAARVTT
jgi:hypothetical protein